MSDLQTSMGDDILQMIVCLRDGKEAVQAAVEHLKSRYPEEASNVALDIKTKLGASDSELARPGGVAEDRVTDADRRQFRR